MLSLNSFLSIAETNSRLLLSRLEPTRTTLKSICFCLSIESASIKLIWSFINLDNFP